MEERTEELDARARFKAGDKVYWQAVAYTVLRRYWRGSEDAIYYDLKELGRPGNFPDMPKKVPENELDAD